MDEKVAQNGKRNDGIRSVYLALYFLGAVVSGVGGNVLYLRNFAAEDIAPDRFTGTQAAKLEERVGHIERDMDTHVRTHPDIVNRFDRRITVLETQYSNIIANQTRIIERLDRMNR